VSLFWQDDVAIRKMPIGGGAITVLDNVRPNTPTAGLALLGGKITYASVDDIRFVPTIGANTSPQVRTIVKASSRVTALHVISNELYWGEQSGAVRRKIGANIKTFPSIMGIVPTSISSNLGGTIVWSQCGSQSCRLRFEFPAITGPTQPVGADALGVSVTSSGVFWGDSAGVHRRTF